MTSDRLNIPFCLYIIIIKSQIMYNDLYCMYIEMDKCPSFMNKYVNKLTTSCESNVSENMAVFSDMAESDVTGEPTIASEPDGSSSKLII